MPEAWESAYCTKNACSALLVTSRGSAQHNPVADVRIGNQGGWLSGFARASIIAVDCKSLISLMMGVRRSVVNRAAVQLDDDLISEPT